MPMAVTIHTTQLPSHSLGSIRQVNSVTHSVERNTLEPSDRGDIFTNQVLKWSILPLHYRPMTGACKRNCHILMQALGLYIYSLFQVCTSECIV